MRAFLTITSTAGTRPPSDARQQPLADTPRSEPARIERICCCFAGGKNSIMRPIVSAASIVCSVEKTRWPDSAACSAVVRRLGVAQLADQDHVRVLAQHAAQRLVEAERCRARPRAG